MALETPLRPPPLHGKCHLKFPFWFFAPLPKPNLLMLRSVKLSFLDTLYLQWTRLFARKIWIIYKRADMTYHQNSSKQPDGHMVSTDPDLWYLGHDNFFHDSDKGPKHVEMFRTKCQPKIRTDKMPTTKKGRTKCQPMFTWHFVLPPFEQHVYKQWRQCK